MKLVIVYHNADLDGFCSGAIAKKAAFSRRISDIEMVGWNYSDPIPEIDYEADYVLVDISFPPDVMDSLTRANNLTWIDHHKSAMIAAHERPHEASHGIRKIGDSASLLAWEYYYPDTSVPEVVYWVDRYDVWKQGSDWDMVMKMQYGMRHHLKNPADEENHFYWDQLFQSNEELETIEQDGQIIYAYQAGENEITCKKAFDLVFEGIKFAAVNSAQSGSSILNSYRRPDHQGLMVFSYNSKDWTVSMYKNELNEGVDLSLIAVRYGGGGHASACGFRINDIQTILKP